MTIEDSQVPTNGIEPPLNRADEAKELLSALQTLILPYIAASDTDSPPNPTAHTLVESHAPKELSRLLDLQIPSQPGGPSLLLPLVEKVLSNSVNTWHQGFLSKLYSTNTPIGLVSDLLLSTLNTNVHVYQVSPVLTLVEKHVSSYLASLFKLPVHEHAGGISQPGGSAANSTAMIIARNTLFPETKTDGLGGRKLTVFTSEHGHYSVEKAAQMFGLGSKNVIPVPVDPSTGAMLPLALETAIQSSLSRGETPFFVNATAGTTVFGAFDPFPEISCICKKYNCWLHIDGSWGGSIVFNTSISETRLRGAELADSIALSPHKMLQVPLTCSFLLGRDIRLFRSAMTLPAAYLFHSSDEEEEEEGGECWDLADLTPQCGRRADSLKFFMALTYHGSEHYSDLIATAFSNAAYLLSLVKSHPHLVSVGPDPLPCLQVCFYWARNKILGDKEVNSEITKNIAEGLVKRGFMIDFAPGERGAFFRVVVNGATTRGTLEQLVKGVEDCAGELGY